MKAKLERRQSPIATAVVALLGDLSSGTMLLNNVIQGYGWSYEQVSSFENLRKLHRDRPVAAVLFEPKALGIPWNEALSRILEAAPDALPMVCQRFSETAVWPDLAEAGAFHSLSLPLDECELRQSLGFVWTAKGSVNIEEAYAAAVA
jgi:hypothetical protein